MRKVIGVVFFFLLVSSTPLQAGEVIDRIVAVVNDDLITLSELKETIATLNTDTQTISRKEERDILEQMIEQKLLEQEAKKLGITVTESEVDAAIESVKRNLNLTDEQMKEVLERQNLSPESFRQQWRIQILANKLIASQLKGQIAITEDEIRKEYEENYKQSKTVDEVRIAHVLIPVNSPDEEEKARETAEKVLKLAESGYEFEKLAKEYSKDSVSAERGGDLGYFKKGDLAKPIEDAVENTPVGGIVGPVRSPMGYHIIKVIDKKEASEERPLEAVRDEIREKLYRQKAEKALKNWIEQIKKTAYIEVKL
jgi:peptidyl-prolyl cis-trans isomerase SurA